MKAFGTIVLSGTLALAIAGCSSQEKKPVVTPVEPTATEAPTTPTYPPVGAAPSGANEAMAMPTMPPADLSAPAPVNLEPAPTPGMQPAVTHTSPPARVAAPKPAAPAHTAHTTRYVVKKGDSLSKIAKVHYGSASRSNINKIIAANPSLKKNPNLIKVGQVLHLP